MLAYFNLSIPIGGVATHCQSYSAISKTGSCMRNVFRRCSLWFQWPFLNSAALVIQAVLVHHWQSAAVSEGMPQRSWEQFCLTPLQDINEPAHSQPDRLWSLQSFTHPVLQGSAAACSSVSFVQVTWPLCFSDVSGTCGLSSSGFDHWGAKCIQNWRRKAVFHLEGWDESTDAL